jgi:SagB-type dehydrogenase family enzyme
MKLFTTIACAIATLLAAASCGTSETAKAPEVRTLPEPSLKGAMSVEEALAARRSVRAYADRALSDEHLGQLLWAAQGITHKERGLRTAPSAGALYPIEIYVFTGDGVFHYSPHDHTLTQMKAGDQRAALATAALGQGSVRTNGAVILIAADYARTATKYGDRAKQYVDIEVGCVCQNVLLQATALGIVGVPVGAYNDADVKRVAALPDEQTPLLLVPLGYPRQE